MWNVLCMAIEGGKAGLYALVPIFAKILNSSDFLVVQFCRWSRDLDIAWQQPYHVS